jgi:hypothetical protein
MLFEMSLSQAALVNLFGRRFSPLEELCFGLTTESLYFNRIDLHGSPTFAAVPEARIITLSDGSSMYLYGVRLRVSQQFDIYGALPVVKSGVTDAVISVGPASGWLAVSVRLEIANGNASLCTEFESLTLPPPPLVSSELAQNAKKAAAAFITKSCTPVPIGDLLNQLTTTLPGGSSVFESTDVLNAGLTLVPGTGSLLIRVEVDAIDPDAPERWKTFFAGTDSPVVGAVMVDPNTPPTPIDWMVTIDRRLFTRIVSHMIANVEAGSNHDGKPGHLDLAKPSIKWHASQALWGTEWYGVVGVPKKLSDGLPTLSTQIEGTAVDVCGGVFGATDIDFTADVTVAFAVPAQDTFRVYLGVTTDASDWDLFKCGVNLAATFSAPLIPVIGPFGVVAGAFLAFMILSLNGGTTGNFAFDKTCHKEYGLDACDYPWAAATPMGTLHLTSIMGLPTGLAFLGTLFASPSAGSKVLSWKTAPKFAWHPISCAPIEHETDYRAEAWVEITGATICDARILDDPDEAYYLVIEAGARHISLFCAKPASSLPQYFCRVLAATTRGVFLAKIPPPSPDVPLAAVKQEQQIMCMDFMTAVDNSHYIDWIKWPTTPADSEPLEIIPADLSLVLIDVTVAGLGAGEVAHLQADGHVVASGMPGPLGFASLLGALDADAVSAQLSVVSAGPRHATPVTRPAVDAYLEFWRSVGTTGVMGRIRDLNRADGESCWLATTYGLLRLGLRNDAPALLDHIPASGIHRLAFTEYGLFTGGATGLGILDPERGDVRTLHDLGPVYALARRGSVLYSVGKDAIRTFSLRWKQDSRGRRRSLVVLQISTFNTHDVRSATLAGRFLVTASDDAINVYEVQRDGGIGPGRSIPLHGLRDIHSVAGADMHDAIVAVFKDRSALIRLDSLVDDRQHKLETLDLPRLPWLVASRRIRNWLVRQRSNESAIDVFKLIRRVDLVRREARLRGRITSTS